MTAESESAICATGFSSMGEMSGVNFSSAAEAAAPPIQGKRFWLIVASLLQVRVAALVERLVGIAHRVGPRAPQHDLEIHRLETLVLIAVDDARRTRDALPRTERTAQAPAAF